MIVVVMMMPVMVMMVAVPNRNNNLSICRSGNGQSECDGEETGEQNSHNLVRSRIRARSCTVAKNGDQIDGY
jgi:hypothetical protein